RGEADMDNEVHRKLRTLLAQPNRDQLLDDPRQLAELVRERLGAGREREARFLNAVMQEGVPKRLLAMSPANLTQQMLDGYARTLSNNTGLMEDVARSAIEAWAAGLGLAIAGAAGPKPPAYDDRAERNPEMVNP